MRLLRLLAFSSLVWACTSTPQELPGDPAAGGKLAREVCATCHIVSDDQLIDPGVGAPSFFEVIADPAVTALSLRVFLQTPHATMPDLILTPEETDDIIAYILRLRDESPEAVEQIDETNRPHEPFDPFPSRRTIATIAAMAASVVRARSTIAGASRARSGTRRASRPSTRRPRPAS